MLDIIDNYINKKSLLDKGETVLLAYSTGVDSSVLLDVLLKLNYNVVIAHVNHNKRKQSVLEQNYAINIAKENNLKIEILDYHHPDENSNFQQDARNARYDFFKEILKKYNIKTIVTAHHKDDLLETIFLNVFRGSNLYGYSGINEKIEYDGYRIVRPLLCVSKKEIYNYAKENNLIYFEDVSNNSLVYTRNKIRHKVVPVLKDVCPNVLDKTLSYHEKTLEAFNFLRECSQKYIDENKSHIDINSFNKLNIALKKDIISRMLEMLEIEMNENQINDILSIILGKTSQADYSLKDNYIFKKRYNDCFIEKDSKIEDFYFKLHSTNDIISLGNWEFFFSKTKPDYSAKYLKICYNNLNFPLVVRNKKDSDFINLKTGHKKLSRIFIDKKIPAEKRQEVPILLDSQGDIIWIMGIAISNDYLSKNSNEENNIYAIWRKKND